MTAYRAMPASPRLNPSHPLVRGSRAFVWPGPFSAVPGWARAGSPWGSAYSLVTASPQLLQSGAGAVVEPVALTLFFLGAPDSAGGISYRPIATTSGGGGTAIEIGTPSSTWSPVLNLFGVTNIGVSLTLTTGHYHAVAITRNRASGATTGHAYDYATGARYRGAATNTTQATNGDGSASVNNSGGLGGRGYSGPLCMAGFVETVWSDSDFASFAADPFGVVRPKVASPARLLAASASSPAYALASYFARRRRIG